MVGTPRAFFVPVIFIFACHTDQNQVIPKTTALCWLFIVQLVFGSAMSGASSYARKPDIKYISEGQVKVLLDLLVVAAWGLDGVSLRHLHGC